MKRIIMISILPDRHLKSNGISLIFPQCCMSHFSSLSAIFQQSSAPYAYILAFQLFAVKAQNHSISVVVFNS